MTKWIIKALGGYTSDEYNTKTALTPIAQVNTINSKIKTFASNLESAIERRHYDKAVQCFFDIYESFKSKTKSTLDDELNMFIAKMDETKDHLVKAKADRIELLKAQQSRIISNLILAVKENEDLKILLEPIDKIAVSNRSKNAISRKNIGIIGELILMGDELNRFNGIGKKSIEEITSYLSDRRLHIGMKLPDSIVVAIRDYSSAKNSFSGFREMSCDWDDSLSDAISCVSKPF